MNLLIVTFSTSPSSPTVSLACINSLNLLIVLFPFFFTDIILVIHETEIKMAKMVKMVKIILTWTFPKVEMAEITSYYIILIRYK
jgi:hypothetical protein